MKNIFKERRIIFSAVLCSMVAVSCSKSHSSDSVKPHQELILVSAITLPFTAPSGIAYSEKMEKLWVVSGDQHVYMLDTNGTVEQKLHYSGTDLEGIAFDATDSTLWTIDEATKELSHLDRDGKVLFRKIIQYSTSSNKGPEGITIGYKHTLYILNERSPSTLFELDSIYDVVQSYELDFASDYSDIAYDESNDSFFILSDEGKAFFIWNTQHGVTSKFTLPSTKNEGIAFDRKRNVFYIVNDSTAQFQIYTLQ